MALEVPLLWAPYIEPDEFALFRLHARDEQAGLGQGDAFVVRRVARMDEQGEPDRVGE